MTRNGKILLVLSAAGFCVSLVAAMNVESDSFLSLWWGLLSIAAGVGSCACAFMCVIDTLMENEE